jgi:primosomal protein N'
MTAATGRVVRVAVDAIADRPERTFSYLLAPDVDAQPGSLLLVPYGRRLALGYLLPGEAELAGGELRPVEAVVSEPMLTDDLLRLAEEIATYYRAPIGTTLAAMLPPGLESRVERRWEVRDRDAAPEGLAESADDAGTVADGTLMRHAPRRGRDAWLERLRRAGAIRSAW